MNRRYFLSMSGRAVAAAALAASLPRLGIAANTPGWSMRLSTSSVMFDTLPIETVFERIARLKFDAVDIWCPFNACGAHCNHLEDVAARLGADGLKALLTKHKLGLCAFSCYGGHYPKYAELLGKVGGGVAIRESASFKPGEDLTARMKDFLERLKPQLDLAAQYNSRLAIENHGGSLLGSIDSFKAFVDLNTNPHLGIALAPYHLQTIKASVEEAITICGSQLCYLYAWQHAKGTEQLPGIGPTDCVPWLKALAKINFTGCVNPFMHNHPGPAEMATAVGKSREYLLQCYQKAVA
ncbi:MAG: TIM barrel protein [Kiritimatiellae bacterium]|nr:TIM barrel protein [Kiritimatiellia bacterium]MDD5521009.1 TIM barrel protein [Kiritimatiellia bacterium]